MYQKCCNSVLPPLTPLTKISKLSAYEYNELYKKHYHRLCPTDEMKEYIADCQFLMGECWAKHERHERDERDERQMYMNTRRR
jgi:hypothetical protein